jgi:ubiquitin carboxyl-terminal hydrolase 44/49
VGTSSGAEAVAHAATHVHNRVVTGEMEDDFVFFQADFSNAFNNASRVAFLNSAKENFPELFPWVQWCYSRTSSLRYGNHTIASCNGTQQGDPLGPLLFSLVLHRVITRIAHDIPSLHLNAGYLDDGTIAGPARLVSEAISIIRLDGPSLGLFLNPQKSVLFWPSTPGRPGRGDDLFQTDIHRTTKEGIVSLGCPIGTTSFVKDFLRTKVNNSYQSLEKLVVLDEPQLAGTLLAGCVSFSKIGYEIRATRPDFTLESCILFDQKVVSTFEDIVGCNLTPLAAMQIQLPTRMGGLGLRSTALHAPAAYTSSSLSTLPLVSSLTSNCALPPILDARVLSLLSERLCEPQKLPTETPKSQKALSTLINKSLLSKTLAKANNLDKARILSCGLHGSGAVFNAAFGPSLDNRLDKQEYHFFVSSRLGLRICNDGKCQTCGSTLDLHGYHVAICKYGQNLKARHNALCEQLFHWCQTAQLAPVREVSCAGGGSVPADIYIPSWENGRSLALDITVVHPQQPALLAHSSKKPAHAAKHAEGKKIAKYSESCSKNVVHFVPVAAEFFGGWSEPAVRFIRKLATRLSVKWDLSLAETKKIMFQNLSVTMTKQNAKAVAIRNATD